MVRDSKGWRIDRRRSVTRYSCQQAAGIAPPLSHLPFPLLSHPRAPPSLARQPSRSLASYGCRVTQEYSPRKCSIDVFSATRPLDGILRCPVYPIPSPSLPSYSCVPFPAYRAPPFTRLQRFIPRSWNTAAVTPSLALIGANCSIFFESKVHQP